MKGKVTIDTIVKGDRMYQTADQLSEIMNESFKFIFREEEAFIKINVTEVHEGF